MSDYRLPISWLHLRQVESDWLAVHNLDWLADEPSGPLGKVEVHIGDDITAGAVLRIIEYHLSAGRVNNDALADLREIAGTVRRYLLDRVPSHVRMRTVIRRIARCVPPSDLQGPGDERDDPAAHPFGRLHGGHLDDITELIPEEFFERYPLIDTWNTRARFIGLVHPDENLIAVKHNAGALVFYQGVLVYHGYDDIEAGSGLMKREHNQLVYRRGAWMAMLNAWNDHYAERNKRTQRREDIASILDQQKALLPLLELQKYDLDDDLDDGAHT